MREAVFLLLFTLAHAFVTLQVVLRAFNSPATTWKVAAGILAMPVLLPLMMFDPDGERLPGWFRVASFPLNSLVWAAVILLVWTAIRRHRLRRRRRGFEVGPVGAGEVQAKV